MPRTRSTTKEIVEKAKTQKAEAIIKSMENDTMTSNEDIKNNEVNLPFNIDDSLTSNLHILEQSTGIKSALLVERILNDALSSDGSFHLISLFRSILNDEKIKLKESQLEALEIEKKQQLLLYKEKELEALKYSLMV